ncbi:MAG: type II secretion system F family protein, partial [Solirubrobacterales bacterium]
LIAEAGLGDRLGPREVAAARVLCVALAAMFVPRVVAVAPGRTLLLLPLLWLGLAAELPLWWLRRTAARRAVALRAALPDALELMRACLSAGLSVRRTLFLVGEHSGEPVAGEFLAVAAETALGVSQATALDGLAARNPLPEVRVLVAAMRQAVRHGSPLAPVVAAQADDARRAHNRATIERAARAGPKIQLIVATTIVPAALIGLAAVVIAAIARGDIAFI